MMSKLFTNKISNKFDVLIVGAGFSGLVMAERLCNRGGLRCLVVDKRNHFGGNAFDFKDRFGIDVHKYGPHYFRTNSTKVKRYLDQFTEWIPVEYRVKSYTDGKLWSFPINLNTFEEFIGRSSTSEEMEQWIQKNRIPIEKPSNSEEVVVSQIGYELYEKFFLGYTLKHWKKHPRDLDPSVCGRIPIRTNRDDRYLKERFQGVPSAGYTALFDRLIDSCGHLLEVRTGVDFFEVERKIIYNHLVFTGPIDRFFDYRFGKLPYRSLDFDLRSFDGAELAVCKGNRRERFYQTELQINYPNENDFTRIVEFKHLNPKEFSGTTVSVEYPKDFSEEAEPYYPIPMDSSKAVYQKYKREADPLRNITFIGRLANYQYYNMDQVVGVALKEANRLLEK